MFNLTCGDYRVVVDPKRGGSLISCEWKGQPILRQGSAGSVRETACFPLVPFSNRIADGKFDWDGARYELAPNFTEIDARHPLHGFSWLCEWDVISESPASLSIQHVYKANEWPWSYRAVQRISLSDDGLLLELELKNLSGRDMPAGLGFHPHFPCNEHTLYAGLHHGEWQIDDRCIPTTLKESEQPRDWWNGNPVQSRAMDTAYCDRKGSINIIWPDRMIEATMQPSNNLTFTVVYSPLDTDFFCVEPVSHSTNALNDRKGEMCVLAPGYSTKADMRLAARKCGS